MASYLKQMEIRVVRTKHRVQFRERSDTAGSLMNALGSVPASAKLLEVDYDAEVVTMDFEDEQPSVSVTESSP